MSTLPFQVTYFEDIAEEHHKVEIVDGLLGAGETTAIYGLPGCGKSVLVGDGACHVAAGRPWFGRRVKQGAVIYVAAERCQLVMRRMAAWRKRYGIDSLPVAIAHGGLDLFRAPAHAEAIVRVALDLAAHHECDPVWIIVDTKAQVMGGADPNSDQDVSAFGANLQLIHRGLPGVHVSVVDHVPHSSPDRMKGSGALAGFVDGSFLVKNEGAVRRLTIGSKAPNDGPEDIDLAFTLDEEILGTSPAGKVTKAPIVVPTDTPSKPALVAKPVPPRRLPEPQAIALRAVRYVLDNGETEPAPREPGVRQGQRAVRMQDAKARALVSGLSTEDDKPDTLKKRWARAVEALVAAGRLRQSGDLIWPLEGTGT